MTVDKAQVASTDIFVISLRILVGLMIAVLGFIALIYYEVIRP